MRYGLIDHGDSFPDATAFPAQSSVLDEEALLSRVVRDYVIPTPVSCRFYDRGGADIYRVKTEASDFYLKIYRPPHTLEQAEAEASFVTALADAEIPIVRPVRRSSGEFASRVLASEGKRPMLLFEEAPPPLPAERDESLVAQLGRRIATMHVAADGFDTDFGVPEIDTDAFLKERVYYTSRFLSGEEGAYLNDVAQRLGVVLNQLPREKPDFGLCHADLVMSNIRMTTEGTITLFDFGNTLQTWRSFELALVYGSMRNRDQEDGGILWQAFLDGYRSIRSLPEALDVQIPLMMVLRMIGFLGGNCASLILRRGVESIESGFIENGMKRFREVVKAAEESQAL